MATTQYCTFALGSHWFGLEVLQVQEILRYHEVTHVPMAPDVVEGLINLRGQIVTAVDLGRLLGIPPSDVGGARMNIIVHGNDSSFSLLVDSIGDVLDLDESIAEPPPDTLSSQMQDLVRRTYKLEKHLLSSINVQAVIDAVAVQVRSAV